MGRRGWLGFLVCALVALPLGYAGWTSFRGSPGDECYACSRAVHAQTRSVAIVNGHSKVFCCPACALTQREQSGEAVRITQLTSFATGKPLAPGNAFVVRGSNINMCERSREVIDSDKRPADLTYDRCSPSLIAFGTVEEAAAFAREHGGEALPFRDVAAALSRP